MAKKFSVSAKAGMDDNSHSYQFFSVLLIQLRKNFLQFLTITCQYQHNLTNRKHSSK